MNEILLARLPPQWTETTLGEIRIDNSVSVSPMKTPASQFELYSIPAHATGMPEVVQGKDVGSSKKSLVPGTVVVSKINPRINRVWVIGAYTDYPKIGSSEWIPFFPVVGLDRDYLAYYMRRSDFQTFLASRVSGVGGSLMRVRPETLAPYPFPIPPLTEQNRIVEAIESHLTRLDDAVASLERVQKNLKRYRASVLKAAVEGRLVPTEAELARKEGREYEPASVLLKRILKERRQRWEEAELAKMKAKGKPPKNETWKEKYKEPVAPDTSELPELPEGWCWTSIGQLSLIDSGEAFKKGDYSDSGLRLFQIANVGIGSTIWDQKHFLPTSFSLSHFDLMLKPGEILIALNRPLLANEFKVTTVEDHDLPAILYQRVGRLRTSDFVASYLFAFLRSPNAVVEVRQRLKGTDQPYLNTSLVPSIPVPLPPLNEQRRLRAEIRAKLDGANESSLAVGRSMARAMRLRQSILKWAFEGKLVDQDPNDEPASVLLDRIKAERATLEAQKKSTATRKKTSRRKK
jgi:type I restriction enzyme, S subunit